MKLHKVYEKIKMVLGPVRNFSEFCKSRPPTIVFFVCIFIIMVTSFYFAFYVKRTEEIINSDANRNWISLIKHLNQADLCVSNSSDNMTLENYYEERNHVALMTAINLNLSQFDNYNATRIHAFFNLEGWHSYCQTNPQDSNFLEVIFDLAPNSNRNDNGTNICALIKGPKHYFPENVTTSCIFNDDLEDNIVTLVSHGEFCDRNTNHEKFNFLFDQDDNVGTYLTQIDKSVIYVHLMWFSCILLFFVLIMLIYAIFYQPENVKNYYRQP